MIAVTDTFTTHEYGPVIIGRIDAGPPRRFFCLTWDMKPVVVAFDDLLPLPKIETGAPDYSVQGVEQIVALEVTLGEDRVVPQRMVPFVSAFHEVEVGGAT